MSGNDQITRSDFVGAAQKALKGVGKLALKKLPAAGAKAMARALGPIGHLDASKTAYSGLNIDPTVVKQAYPEASDEIIQKIIQYSFIMAKSGHGMQKMPPKAIIHQLASPKIKTHQDVYAIFKQNQSTMVAMREDTTNMDIKELIKSMILKELDGYDAGPDRDGPTRHWSDHQMQHGRISPSQRGISSDNYKDIVAKEIAMHFCLTVGMESIPKGKLNPFWREFIMIAEKVASGELPHDHEYTYDNLPTHSGEDEGRPDGSKMKRDLSYGATAPVIAILKHIGGMRKCGLELPESLQALAFEPFGDSPKYDDDLFDEPPVQGGTGIPRGPAKPLAPSIPENIVTNIINIIEEETENIITNIINIIEEETEKP